MLRTFALALAVIAAAPLAQKVHQLSEPAAPAQPAMLGPEMLGKKKPVFLGRMTVEATALPEQVAAR